MGKKRIARILIGIGIILAVVGYFILPDTVVVQISSKGTASNTLPRLAALGIPLALNVLGTSAYVKGNETQSKKGLVAAIAGHVVAILTLVVNIMLKIS